MECLQEAESASI